MPRRLPVRPAKVFGNFFVLLVLSVIALIYYTFVVIVWAPRLESKLEIQQYLHTVLFIRSEHVYIKNSIHIMKLNRC